MSKWHGGKGSARRKEDSKKIADNWDAIFGKKSQPQQHQDPEDPKLKEQAQDPRNG